MNKGYVTDATIVYGYVLGDQIHSHETGERKEGDRIVIRPMLYSTFVGQAEKRLLNLHKRLSNAPFMKDVLNSDDRNSEDFHLPIHEPLIATAHV